MARQKKAPKTPLQKLADKIGPDGSDIIQELESVDVTELNKRIAQSSQSIIDTKEELDKNKDYQQVKYDKSILESGLNEVKKRQNAIIKVCLMLRKERGAA